MRDKPSVHRIPPIRNRHFFATDLLLTVVGAAVSFWLRLDIDGLAGYRDTLFVFTALALVMKPLVFYGFGLYRRYWRYAGPKEATTIALATLAGTAVTTLVAYSVAPLFVTFRPIPRSIPIIDWLVTLVLVGGVRFAFRLVVRHDIPFIPNKGGDALKRAPAESRRVLVMGAGDAGAMIVREMLENPGLGLRPVAFLDDDPRIGGMTIYDVPVRGPRQAIPHLIREDQADEVIIAMPTAPGKAIQDVVKICRDAGVPCKTVPGIFELLSGEVTVRHIRDIGIDDLLRRDPVEIDDREACRYLQGAVVLVTGAGGSIGSELCRQIAACGPRRLLLMGHGENSIYDILHEIRERFPQIEVQPIIADIRHRDRLEALFRCHRPDVVFHAAAHKHVPLMEQNLIEAVTNNVLGTRALLAAAEAYGTERFVFISTDKAVNPVNVMGATKRVAELLVQDAARRTGRAYAAVRFGNVLGSRGSVVPLFQQQITQGGPVIVTHPEMERYFMTIPEAVQLVIQAGAAGRGGEIFVLDMGEQVRILDLAEQLIELSGLELGRDIDIVFTQPRPGEKLSEELFCHDEEPCPTQHAKILRACGKNCWTSQALADHLAALEDIATTGERAALLAKLQEVVPGYHPHKT